VGPGVSRVFALFAGVFEGGFGKSGAQSMVFCGENVVGCVVIVARKRSFLRDEK
jgi:hypothetical protein